MTSEDLKYSHTNSCTDAFMSLLELDCVNPVQPEHSAQHLILEERKKGIERRSYEDEHF